MRGWCGKWSRGWDCDAGRPLGLISDALPSDSPRPTVTAMPEQARHLGAQDLPGTLSSYARDLYEDSRLVPLLRRLMTASCTLTASAGSSISIVDPDAGRYTKVAERGTACRLGESFPLDEGVTGRVMASRRPVVLASYRDVATGHLPPHSQAKDGAVVAIPIWWRGEVIGANVVFAGCQRAYTTDEIDQLEVITQVVAPGIVTAAGRDLGMTSLFSRPDGVERPGPGDPGSASVAEVARGLASLVTRVGGHVQGGPPPLEVRVLRDQSVLRLQVKDAHRHADGWRELVQDADGEVRRVGTADPRGGSRSAAEPSSPLTVRERQVAVLLSRGMSDRAIAETLIISPKTAEKHVGAVLRKTGTSCRTAAVVHALEQGWLTEHPAGIR